MSPALLFFRLGILAAPLFLTGCGIYYPHTPATPLVQRGQLEARPALQPLTTVSDALTDSRSGPFVPTAEASVAYAPLPHLTILAAGGGNHVGARRHHDREYFRQRQADIGLGFHTGPAPKSYLAALAGFGLNRTGIGKDQHSPQSSPAHSFASTRCDARYRRLWAQAYAARELDNLTLALYLRRSWLQYQSIVQTRRSYGHDTETTSLPPRHFPTGYFELGGAIRLGQGPWQAILDLYVSGPTKKVTPDPDQINFATGSLTVMTIGVVLRPHLLAQAAKPSPATP